MMYVFIFIAQMASSLLRTSSIIAVVKNNRVKFLTVTAISDLLFYSVTASVTKMVIDGSYLSIGFAVFGGIFGNIIAVGVKK
ncbi:hypothetical protein [Methylomonas sp. 11b]|uniref:hypothetical protein n=1 Tax=Methylomonas sp. 11b TaxID=1168169 RepID=UPI000478D9C5|nr:hypothetical protein [Methylomonas sp. 11b]